MITPQLADHLLNYAAKDLSFAIKLVDAIHRGQASVRYQAATDEKRAQLRERLLGDLLATSNYKSVMDVIEAWEAENLRKIDTAGLSEEDVSPIAHRRYMRGLVNALKYSPTAMEAIRTRHQMLYPIFQAAVDGQRGALQRLEDAVLQQIGRERLAQDLRDVNGYDLERDVQHYQPYDAVGEVLYIPAQDAEFKRVIRERRHWVYNKFTVSTIVVDGVASWVIFFT
jgi:hypothetical protein